MPIIYRSRYRLYLCLLLFFILTGYLVYRYWFDLMLISQQWQRYFHQQLTSLLINVKVNPLQAGLSLITLSFLYGILHAAGPGHGKVIITTYLATQPNQLKKSMWITLLAALMQGVIAISLVSLILMVFSFSAKQLKLSEYWLELFSYLLIILLGIILTYKAIKKMVYHQLLHPTSQKNQLQMITAIRPISATNHITKHSPDCACCGHQHIPSPKQIAQSQSWYHDLAIIMAIGIRPCSGALLVLMFAYIIGAYYWGILATLAMSIGTAITTTLFALLVYGARKTAEHLMAKSANKSFNSLSLISQIITLIGGVLFIIMGIILALSIESSTTIIHPLLG